jgi:alkylmercury lyase
VQKGEEDGMSVTDIDVLADALRSAQPALDGNERLLVREVYAALALGQPVSVTDLARRTGKSENWISDRFESWPGVFRDDEGRVIAFWGLSIVEMGHRFEVDGRTLYTWCAWDPMFLAPLLGANARVSSTCPVTGRTISLSVGVDGLSEVDPSGAVLSFLQPSAEWKDDVIESFCHFVLLFASREAGTEWVADHPGTFLLGLDEAFELGRRARMFS